MPVPITPERPTLSPTQAPGSGWLRFAHVAGRTVLTRASATSPLKLFNPRNAGTSAWAYRATEIANHLLATWTRAIAVNA